MSDQKRERSKAYPQHALEPMVEALFQVNEKLGSGPYSRDHIAEALGHSPGSGTANGKAAALVHYHFFERQHNAYELSALATRILHPTDENERREALVEAALSPTLFSQLVEKFEGKSLPQLLPNILTREFGITSKQSANAAEVFRATLEFSSLLKNGIVRATPASVETPKSEGDTETVHKDSDGVSVGRTSETQSVKKTASPSIPNNETYQIPLSRGRIAVLSLPRSVSQSDLDKVIGWINLMADVLTESLESITDTQKETPGAK